MTPLALVRPAPGAVSPADGSPPWPADGPLASLPPISLAALEASASLLHRVDRKYVVPVAMLPSLAAALPSGSTMLEIGGRRCFTYRSVYFDTERLDSYLGAARGRRDRFKVRTRTYADAGTCVLEVKVRDHRGATVKHRLAHDPTDEQRLTAAGAAFVDEVTGRVGLGGRLAPVLVTTYRRATVAAADGSFRLTIDDALRCEDGAGTALVPGHLIVESKSAGPATVVDRWLWRSGVRPVAVSKFGTGLGALHRELPANKWHRVIGAYFAVCAGPARRPALG